MCYNIGIALQNASQFILRWKMVVCVYITHVARVKSKGLSTKPVGINVPRELILQRYNGGPDAQRSAKKKIVERARRAYISLYGIDPGVIRWSQLVLDLPSRQERLELERLQQEAGRHPRQAPAQADTALATPAHVDVLVHHDERECDDCPACDTGRHDRCRSGNCPIAEDWA